MDRTKVDWRVVINTLKRYGFTAEQLSQEVGTTRRTIMYWREGSCEPSYSRGAKLLSVYETVVRTTR